MAKREHSYNSGRIHRAGSDGAAVAPMPVRQKKAKKRRRKRRWPVVVLTLFLVLALGAGAAWAYAEYILDTGNVGNLDSDLFTPQEYNKDVVNILLVGIDMEEGRSAALTDVILYCNYNVRDNEMNIFQIPRDSYVGNDVPTGGTGKINAVYSMGEDKENPINNIAKLINNQFKLPIDYYVSIDMDGFKAIIDTLGGIDVYIPKDLVLVDESGTNSLPKGWHRLSGAAAEFFVRVRNFQRGDIDRLDNQRYFYSALFHRFMEMSFTDIVKLMPVFQQYCNTDMNVQTVLSLAMSAGKLDKESVLFCRPAGVTGLNPPGHDSNHSVYTLELYGRAAQQEGGEATPGVAELLNTYFRTYGEQYSAEQLGLPQIQIPQSMTLYPYSVQRMGEIQDSEVPTEGDTVSRPAV